MKIAKIVKIRKIIWACLFGSSVHFFSDSVLAQEQILVGQVVAVSDGDTLKVLDDGLQLHVIRLMGIDAPEKAQAFGQQAKHSLARMVFQQRVSVVWSKKDKYGRTVGKVLRLDGQDVCMEQVALGMAWHYKQYASEQFSDDRLRYADAHINAKEAQIGLWQDPSAVPPWSWRHAGKH